MIEIKEKAQFEKAIAKAQAVKPKTHIIEAGRVYSVESSQGDEYQVTFFKLNGVPAFTCTCKAHTGSAAPKVCYHAVAAWSQHRVVKAVHKAAEASPEPFPIPVATCRFCKTPSTVDSTGLCNSCAESELFS